MYIDGENMVMFLILYVQCTDMPNTKIVNLGFIGWYRPEKSICEGFHSIWIRKTTYNMPLTHVKTEI